MLDTTFQEARVKTCLAQLLRRALTDLMTMYAVGNDLTLTRQRGQCRGQGIRRDTQRTSDHVLARVKRRCLAHIENQRGITVAKARGELRGGDGVSGTIAGRCGVHGCSPIKIAELGRLGHRLWSRESAWFPDG